MADIYRERILILDFGSQTTQLIARRIRDAGVYCEIHPYDLADERIRSLEPRGIVLSGGPESVTLAPQIAAPAPVFALGVPVLGICYGMQTMAAQLGGTVESSCVREFGFAQISISGHSSLFKDIEDHLSPDGHGVLDAWMSHGDRVIELPPGFIRIAASEGAPIAGMADEARRYYGLQFHPEVTHTRQGQRILARFIHEICGCGSSWTTASIIADSMVRVRERVGQDCVLLALSGGVDSSVVAALLQRAIGDQLTCVFVDNGLLRLNEADQVMAAFTRHLHLRVLRVNAADRFLNALAGLHDPEEKRKAVGREFIQVFEEAAQALSNVVWLAQGTIYPDVIESAHAATGKAHVIKSHHNVGGLPERMRLKLIEPLRELFKDEVRKIGIELGLPYDMVYRHPFPGPGLAVRILGEVTAARAEILRRADMIFIDELRRQELYEKVSQAFAVLLPVNSVGVTGDARHYAPVVALRAVETLDFMTARWAPLAHEFLDHVARRILNEVPGVSRVVYDISGKPPATIEWE